jgi:hydrogenase maturation protein HypF
MQDVAAKISLCSEQEARIVAKMADQGLNAVVSTSAGRLFDAASAICGICRKSTFEGEASMALEFAAERFDQTEEARVWSEMEDDRPERSETCWILPTEKIIRAITYKRLAGEDADHLAWLFHRRLADQIIQAVLAIRSENGIETAALSGGCFQNRLLLSFVEKGLTDAGMTVLIHHLVPPNDGGIALGQAVYARQALQDGLPFRAK